MSLGCIIGSLINPSYPLFKRISQYDSSTLYVHFAFSKFEHLLSIHSESICSINIVIVHYHYTGNVFQVFQSCKQHHHRVKNFIHHKIRAWSDLVEVFRWPIVSIVAWWDRRNQFLRIWAEVSNTIPKGVSDRSICTIWLGKIGLGDISRSETLHWGRRTFLSDPACAPKAQVGPFLWLI